MLTGPLCAKAAVSNRSKALFDNLVGERENAGRNLKAERERRIDTKVAEDRAIREQLIVVLEGGPEDIDAKVESARAARLAEVRAAGEKREVVFEKRVIITGVRRSGRDVDVERTASIGEAQPRIADDKPDYTSHLKTYGTKAPPPRPKPPAEAVKPPEPGPIQTQVRAPSQDGKDPGEVISGWYDIQGGMVVVWERSGGAPIGRAPCAPGDDPKVIARRILREKRNGPSGGFYGPISYRTH